jgi:SAM-dependent methyltransferase
VSLVLDEHRQYLADRPRIEAFRAAMRAAIRPGDVVLDLACGSGILGFLACDAGARRVYAIDDGPIIDMARRFARANGYADRIVYVRELSTRAALPEPVDVVVCDQIGHIGMEAGAFEYLADARRRLLKPAGRTVPSALTFIATPVESEDIRSRVAFWSSRPARLDATAAREIAENTGYPQMIEEGQLLARPAAFASAALPAVDAGPIRGEAIYVVSRSGLLDGVGVWFDAELAPGVRMTNAPGDPNRINRRQVVLPLEVPVPVDEGDSITIQLTMVPPDTVNWRASISSKRSGNTRTTSAHSTFRGTLLSAEDLARTNPDSRPALTPFGRARRSVLELCDGDRQLRQVQDEVYARHRDLFPTRNDAAAFVAEVVTVYTVPDAAVSDRQPADR